jgi:hypothetical protein
MRQSFAIFDHLSWLRLNRPVGVACIRNAMILALLFGRFIRYRRLPEAKGLEVRGLREAAKGLTCAVQHETSRHRFVKAFFGAPAA